MQSRFNAVLTISLLVNLLMIFGSLALVGRKMARQSSESVIRTKDTLSPWGRRLHEHIFNSLPVTHHRIVLLGDSITSSFDAAELLPGADIANRGCGGDLVDGMEARLEEAVQPMPDKVFVLGGINDLSSGRTPEQVNASMQRLLGHLKARLPHTTIYLQSILPVNAGVAQKKNVEIGAPHPAEDLNTKIRETNTLLQKNADVQVKFLDLYSDFAAGSQMNAEYVEDGLHLNGKGYIKWADILTHYIR